MPYLEDCASELQHELSLPVKECSPAPAPRSGTAITTQGEKITDDGGCSHVSPASHHRLSGVHENPQQCSTAASLACGPASPPSCPDGPSLHPPSTPCATHQCYGVIKPSLSHSPPSENHQHSCVPYKELSDAIFGASDEELSSLSDADTFLGSLRASAMLVQSRRVRRKTGSSKRCTRSQRPRDPALSARPNPVVSSLGPTQDAAAEQKLAPVVKRLRIMDSQDTVHGNLLDTGGRNPATPATRKMVMVESGDEIEDTSLVTPISKTSPLPASDQGPQNRMSLTKRGNAVPAAQAGRTATGRPKRTCVSSTKVEPKPLLSAPLDRPDLDYVHVEKNFARGTPQTPFFDLRSFMK